MFMLVSFCACGAKKGNDADDEDKEEDTNKTEDADNIIAVETEHFKISGSMMEYFFRERYNEYVNELSYYIQAGYIKLDTSKSLKAQIQSGENTWFDYFMDITTNKISQLLAYCEGAYSEGIALTAEEKAEVDAAVKALYDQAKAECELHGINVKRYMAGLYGDNVNENVIYSAKEIEALAAKYAKVLYDRIGESITSEEVEKYYKDHFDDYFSADYLSYEFKVVRDFVKESDYNGDFEVFEQATKASIEKYEAVKADAKEKAEELSNKSNADSFKAHIKSNLEEDYRVKGGDNTITKSEQKEIDDKMKALLTTNFAHGHETSLEKWIYGASCGCESGVSKGASVNDVYVVEDENEEDGVYTITVYMLTREAGRNTSSTKNVFYAAFPLESSSDANTLVSAFESSFTKDFDTFEALAKVNNFTDDAIIKKKTDLSYGEMGYYELDEWIFDERNSAGMINNIVLDKYSVVVYIVGDGAETWYADVHEAMTDEASEKWITDKIASLDLKYNTKFINNIDA